MGSGLKEKTVLQSTGYCRASSGIAEPPGVATEPVPITDAAPGRTRAVKNLFPGQEFLDTQRPNDLVARS